ncbi:MAG: hypothetical protein A2312_03655 [Candidatus Staskawiczbacteria bacterium RIFOXYB2_FULL_32_9]|uniref:Uncharacterized protein n=1 Tax=Candidatus Staskawiczbacteria bacterium RIFOXYD1_FULL_32_13 TaxID=1802234 RepID=A0A1G2JMZ6_9BACT|nr:MAG: hypothetical protein UR22_C0002G0018 [Parcubacteria group bacterium GW2011_GWC2_32_10]OGZ80185.1 MAG: hypothetical protein A2360_00225 [Candidatus Staskawiczbacteria bacterium RIFOXYB1_FULL_32_11]OGZ80193.1 MAG: hypothetical protein A2256_00130 [Candidatus Staskawiczbacteria bacterium RIFOXYA2_FULL_32_7]OGZ82279.1 MAG: hypothetical protein A2312_03655 [Candidatus Staskawiczbacteria bacterium RIFOXYB2_FULL_32_9]OGZ86862.1 MAG: hypothetical protein A2463_01790 [Candidatus Staskawiczbacter
MILLVHIIFGTAVGSLFNNPILGIMMALLSHYFLDLFPHIEYPIDNLKNIRTNFKKALPELFYLFIDFALGVLFIFIFTNKSLIFFIYALISIAPDFLTVLSAILPNKILKIHDIFHRKYIHFLRDKKISNFYRISIQIVIVIISFIILK